MNRDLLSIDVTSELRTLCAAQLRGTWQVPAEIIRLAFRLGAEEAAVDRSIRSFVVRWPDAELRSDTLCSLRTALDAASTPPERQQAIVEIEQSGAEALLWAGGLRGARLEVITQRRENRQILHFRDGRRPRVATETTPARKCETVIRWSCSGLRPRSAEAWLLRAVRFADQKVSINGTEAPRGFSDGMFNIRVDEPIPARLGLTRTGDEPVLWLLKNGVVAARAGLPGYPPFEAAIEMSSEVPSWASSADLRRAVSPHLGRLVDQVVWMLREVAGRWPDHDPATRDRLVLLLLRAARRKLRSDQIRKLRFLPTVAGRDLSIDDVEDLARRRGGLIANLETANAGNRSVGDPDATLRVSGEVRSLLAELVDIRYHAPRGRRTRRIDRFRLALRSAWRRAGRRLRGLSGATVVEEEALSPGERRTLALLRPAVDPWVPVLRNGPFEPATGSKRVFLGRSDPTVIDAGLVLAKEPDWIYPVLLALELGADVTEVRRKWRTALGASD